MRAKSLHTITCGARPQAPSSRLQRLPISIRRTSAHLLENWLGISTWLTTGLEPDGTRLRHTWGPTICADIQLAPHIMEHPLDQTTLSTISLLESRLLRIEHLLYGSSTPSTAHESALRQMADLEKRFSILTSRIRVYGDLLKICTSLSALSPLARFLLPGKFFFTNKTLR